MAKIPFSKLKVKVNEEVITISFNEIDIEVKKYLPLKERIAAFENITALMFNDDSKFLNESKFTTLTTIEVVKAYTNITFTDKQLEDVYKLYDQIYSSGLYAAIEDALSVEELEYNFWIPLRETITSIFNQRNSALGIMENIATNYKEVGDGIAQMRQDLSNGENVEFLKEVMTKLG